MQVVVRYFTGCPHWQLAADRLGEAIGRVGADVRMEHEVIETPEQAERAGFCGSPSLLIDGHDPFEDQAGPIGLSCRIYRTEHGPEGAPSVDQLVAVLAK